MGEGKSAWDKMCDAGSRFCDTHVGDLGASNEVGSNLVAALIRFKNLLDVRFLHLERRLLNISH